MNFTLEDVLLPMQRLQQQHDDIAHRDILSFELHKRLKHMVLHFYKYSGKIQAASETQDQQELRRILLDAFIICMATANSLNLSLGEVLSADVETPTLDSVAHAFAKHLKPADLFASSVRDFVLIGGRMAKSVESADHMEPGNPRSDMASLVPQLTQSVLAHLGHLDGGLEDAVRARLGAVERKSIFRR